MSFEIIEDTQAVFYASDDFHSIYTHPLDMKRDASSFSSPSYNTFHPHSSCDLPLVNFSWISPLGTASTETDYGREIVDDDSESDIDSYLDCFYDSLCTMPADAPEDDTWDCSEPSQNPVFVPSTPLSGKADLDFVDLDDRPRRISVIVLNEEIRSPSYESLHQEDGSPRASPPTSRRPSRESMFSVKVISPEHEGDPEEVYLPVIGSSEAVAVAESSTDVPTPRPRPSKSASGSNDMTPARQVSIFLPSASASIHNAELGGGFHSRAHPLRRLSRVIHAKTPQPTSSRMRQTVFLMVEVDPPPACPTAPPPRGTRTEVVYEPRAGGLKSLLHRLFKKRRGD